LTWVSDIKGALSWLGLTEYLDLWDALSGFVLNPTEDIHHWKPESSGIFSTKSAYPFSSAPSPLNHGSDYGSLGLRGNAKLSYGWPFGTVVGWQTDWKKEVFPILIIASSAIKKMRQSNTSSLHVSSPDNSGLKFYNL